MFALAFRVQLLTVERDVSSDVPMGGGNFSADVLFRWLIREFGSVRFELLLLRQLFISYQDDIDSQKKNKAVSFFFHKNRQIMDAESKSCEVF